MYKNIQIYKLPTFPTNCENNNNWFQNLSKISDKMSKDIKEMKRYKYKKHRSVITDEIREMKKYKYKKHSVTGSKNILNRYKNIPNGKYVTIYKNNTFYFGEVIDHKFNNNCIGIKIDKGYYDDIQYSSLDHIYDLNYANLLINELITEFENTKENRLNLLLLDSIYIIESYNKKYCIVLEHYIPPVEWVEWPTLHQLKDLAKLH